MKNFLFNNFAVILFILNGLFLVELIGGEVSFIPRGMLLILGCWCGEIYVWMNKDD